MADYAGPSLFLAVLLVCFSVAVGGEYCETGYGRQRHRQSSSATYCAYGCCGYPPDQHCCSVTAGLVVGCAFAAIAAVSVIGAMICCCIKKKGLAGRVVQPSPSPYHTEVTVVYTGASGQYPEKAFSQPMGVQPVQPVQPPPYNAAGAPPPAYSFIGPAYPPAGNNAPPSANNYNLFSGDVIDTKS